MPFQQIASIFSQSGSLLAYRVIIERLRMTITLVGENSDLFELNFEGVQSYKFIPDDLANLSEEIDMDAFQRALDKNWIDELRVPSDVHRKYLERHELYVMHATDIGLLEVVAVSGEFKDLR
jgi:hypothetical protein